MCILETSSERCLEKFRKICRKAKESCVVITTKFLQKYAMLTLSLDVICDVTYHLHDIAVESAMNR